MIVAQPATSLVKAMPETITSAIQARLGVVFHPSYSDIRKLPKLPPFFHGSFDSMKWEKMMLHLQRLGLTIEMPEFMATREQLSKIHSDRYLRSIFNKPLRSLDVALEGAWLRC